MFTRLTLIIISTTCIFAQTRIIPHITRAGGGFKTEIILENTTTSTQPYQFHSFDTSGQLLAIHSGIHQANSISVLEPDQLFGAQNDVSHFTIEASSGITVAVTYQAASGPGSPAHVRESSVQAKTWRLYAGNWSLIFDGFAAINTGSAAADISLAQVDANGQDLATQVVQTGLQPNAKKLFVMSDAFQTMDDVYYEIRSNQPLAVTSLRGTAPSADEGYLWENSAAQFEAKQGNSSSSLEFPFWETVTTGPEAFRITQEGGGMAARFEINNVSSSNDALYVTHNGSGNVLNATQWGSGRAAFIRQQEPSNTMPALEIDNKGASSAILATSSGAAMAAEFVTTDEQSNAVSVSVNNYGLNAGAWVHNRNPNSTAAALWAGTDSTSGGTAAYFSGDVHVSGRLSKSSGSFKIDHPLDPANKVLSHSFVESPDMMNVYNGNALLDADGTAWIELPAYFEALNHEFRYQLTPIGAPAGLYVEREIEGNRFRIAGGNEGLKVSWQVTGVRNDAYAQKHPIVVETFKSAQDRGQFLNPDVFDTAAR